MTTRNIFALGLSIGACWLFLVGAAAVPMDRETSEHVLTGRVPSGGHTAPGHEYPPAPVGETQFVDYDQAPRPDLGSGEMSPPENELSAGSVQLRAQLTPTVRGKATSNPPEPTETVLRLVVWGAGLAVVSLLAFGAYSILRGRVRTYLGRMRNRQLHRQRRHGRRRKKDEEK